MNYNLNVILSTMGKSLKCPVNVHLAGYVVLCHIYLTKTPPYTLNKGLALTCIYLHSHISSTYIVLLVCFYSIFYYLSTLLSTLHCGKELSVKNFTVMFYT